MLTFRGMKTGIGSDNHPYSVTECGSFEVTLKKKETSGAGVTIPAYFWRKYKLRYSIRSLQRLAVLSTDS